MSFPLSEFEVLECRHEVLIIEEDRFVGYCEVCGEVFKGEVLGRLVVRIHQEQSVRFHLMEKESRQLKDSIVKLAGMIPG